MEEKRSLFNMVFGNIKQKIKGAYLQLMSGYNAVFSNSADIEESLDAIKCIDTISKHVAKMIPKHIKGTTSNNIKGEIDYILKVKPNPVMTKYDFLYKTTFLLLAKNNMYIYIDKDKTGMIRGFYPLNPDNCTLYEYQNEIYIKFQFMNGNYYFIRYDEVIHLRRMFGFHDLYGSDNLILNQAIKMANTTNEGIDNAIKTSMSIKGILKYGNAMLKDKDIKSNRDRFVEDFIGEFDTGKGIAGLDAKSDFIPVNLTPITLDKEQLAYVKNNIFDYFGVSENIVRGKFTEEEWNAFYESVLEVYSIQYEDAYSLRIFSDKALKEGHRIAFTTNRIKYASLRNKISLLKEAGALGLLTKDDGREILDMSPIGGTEGAKILQSLNNINSKIADNYQGGKKNGNSNKTNEN